MRWTVAIGIDTHKHAHLAVALDRLGTQLDCRQFAASTRGYLELLAWAQSLGAPAFAIEGCGSYGAGLARLLEAGGELVYECERPRRREHRRGKSDLIDATLAAGRLLSGSGLSRPRGGGVREDLRLLLLERRGAVRAQTAALNQLRSVLVTAPASVRERLEPLGERRLLQATLRLRSREASDCLVAVLRRLARRAAQLQGELAEVDASLEQLTAKLVPELLAECGVGPVCAAQLVVSSGDPARMRSEASFAALGGTSPVDASSGRQQRHRLNRGGDRQLNRALHVIALNRIRFHAETAAYHERLLAAGKTSREARRCVKRALARYFHRRLCELPQLTGAAAGT